MTPSKQFPIWWGAGARPVDLSATTEAIRDEHIFAPVGAVIVLIAASIVCLFFIPDEVGPVGALRLPAVILAFGLLAGPAWYARKDFRWFFQPAFVLATAPVFWVLLDMIQGSYAMWGYEPEDVRKTFITISIFSISAWMAALRPKNWLVERLPVAVFRQFSPQFYFSIGLAAFGLAFIRFAVPCDFDLRTMYNALLEDRWAAPWARESIGGWDAFLEHFAYFGYILPVLTVALARRLGWFAPRTLLLGVCSIVIALFLAQGGGRRILGVLLASAAVYWFLTLKQKRFIAIISLCLALIGIGIAMNFMLEIRGTGLGGAGLAEEKVDRPFEKSELDDEMVFFHIDDNFLRLTQMNYIFPRFVPYTTWQYITYVVVRPIPRALWPGKPLTPGFDFSAAVGAEGTLLTCSVIGELVMCGGYLAVCLGGLFYGFIAASLAPLRSNQSGAGGLLLYSCGLLMLFAGFRSLIELILMSYMLLAYIALTLAYERFSGHGRW